MAKPLITRELSPAPAGSLWFKGDEIFLSEGSGSWAVVGSVGCSRATVPRPSRSAEEDASFWKAYNHAERTDAWKLWRKERKPNFIPDIEALEKAIAWMVGRGWDALDVHAVRVGSEYIAHGYLRSTQRMTVLGRGPTSIEALLDALERA